MVTIKGHLYYKAHVQNADEKMVIVYGKTMEELCQKVDDAQYRNNFILKGGMLVSAVVGLDTRATMDIDTTVKSLELSKENLLVS